MRRCALLPVCALFCRESKPEPDRVPLPQIHWNVICDRCEENFSMSGTSAQWDTIKDLENWYCDSCRRARRVEARGSPPDDSGSPEPKRARVSFPSIMLSMPLPAIAAD